MGFEEGSGVSQEGGKGVHMRMFMWAMWSQLGTKWGMGGLECEPRGGQGSSFGSEREAGTPHSMVHEGSVVTIGTKWDSRRVGCEPKGRQGSAYVDVHVISAVTIGD